MATRKDPGVASVLAFLLPGLGQIYNGRLVEGLAWFAGHTFTIGTIIAANDKTLVDIEENQRTAVTIFGSAFYIIGFIYQIYRAYTYAESLSTPDRTALKERAISGWVCSTCGRRLLYTDDACPKCRATGRKWAG